MDKTPSSRDRAEKLLDTIAEMEKEFDKVVAEKNVAQTRIKQLEGMLTRSNLKRLEEIEKSAKLQIVFERAKHVMPDLCGPCDGMTRKLNEAIEAL